MTLAPEAADGRDSINAATSIRRTSFEKSEARSLARFGVAPATRDRRDYRNLQNERTRVSRDYRACVGYSPLKSAFLFSPNALMPSFASCDTKTRLIASRSMASPRSSGAE
jgi:hypothetical protein